MTLTGALENVTSGGMIDYRMSRTNEHLRIRAWIRHLALNACAPAGVDRTTRHVTEQCLLTFSPVEHARETLDRLIDLYWQGMHRPLHFFPRAAWVYAQSPAPDIGSKVWTVWHGAKNDDDQSHGECRDPYYQLAFRGTDPLDAEFRDTARTVFGPMLDATKEEPLP